MTLLDAETYAAITGDDATPTGAQLTIAEKRVCGFLHRIGVASGTYTERLYIHRGGVVYPSALAITNAGDARVDGPAVYVIGAGDSFVSPWQTPGFTLLDEYGPEGRSAYGSLTYAAGWTLESAPQPVLDGLAWETWRVLNPGKVPAPGPQQSVAVGAQSLTTGDAAITYGAAGGPQTGLYGGGDVMAATAAALIGYIHRELTP